MSTLYLYVGTYTRPAPYLATTNGKGLYVFRFDPDSGDLAFASEASGVDNPSFVAISPNQRFLYATSEVLEWPEGLVCAYAIDPVSGGLTYLNKQSSFGWLAAYATVEKSGRWLALVNYLSGNAVLLSLLPNGKVGEASEIVQHSGSGPDASRQEGPHTHSIVIDPNNRYAIVADLGIDKIVSYRLDVADGKLVRSSECPLPAGTGPRHFVFHPSGKFAYVINELSSTLGALAYDTEAGTLELLQLVPALPADHDIHSSHCADIQVHPSGKFLYGSNRGHDSIVIHAIDEQTGRLSYVGHQSTGGRTPRNFAIDPSGAYLLAANQDSDTIVTFRIDAQTGQLTPTGAVASCPTPVCLKFAVLP